MTDSLRTRIADALMTAESTDAERYALADAVIAELKLREELKYPGRFTFMPPQRRRYVTEWETDQ